MLCFKIRSIGFWEYLVYTIGLSVAFIMFAGLHANWTLPALGITDKPLSTIPILVEFDIFLVILSFFAYFRNKDLEFKIQFPKFSWLDRIFIIIPMFFPVLSVLGAFLLNNNGPNVLTMIMLGGIAVYVFLVVLFRNKLNEHVYPWALWMIGLSLLLMVSLRGQYIGGADMSLEFKTFQEAKTNYIWNFSISKDNSYNSCLSIVLLPIIFEHFIDISGEFIFKLLFPLCFSFVSILVYIFSKKQVSNEYSFLSAIFFVSQFTFIFWLPILARQEIAFLFFGLILLVLFNKEINPTLKKVLFLIFGFSMIVSHYSTSYIALAIFLFAYILIFFYKLYENRNIKRGKLKPEQREQFYLTGILILLLLIFGFLWYGQITSVSSDLATTLVNTSKNLNRLFLEELKSYAVTSTLSLSLYSNVENPQLLNEYVNSSYTEDSSLNYPDKTPDIHTKYFKYISPPFTKIYFLILLITKILITLLKIFIFIGVIIMLLNKNINKEYKGLAFISLILLILFLFLPYISLNYNFERLSQQIFILIPMATIIPLIWIQRRIRSKDMLLLPSIFFILIFLSNSGFFWQIFGGNPDINLNNFGMSYSRGYTHQSELVSLAWINNNSKIREIFSDDISSKKFYAYSKIKPYNNIVYGLVRGRGNYIYSGYHNKNDEVAIKSFKGKDLFFNFPKEFINDNKNKIYSNGGSEIFK